MSEPFEPVPTKAAICKECKEQFQVDLVFAKRHGKSALLQKTYWCSPLCRNRYYTRIKQR